MNWWHTVPTDTFASYARRLDTFVNGLSGSELKQVMTKVGVEAKGDALSAASGDLGGDPAFSGWPGQLDTRFDHIGPGRISFHPTRRSAGKWTVAEHGRHAAAGPPGGKRSRRWNGRTRGKGTATKALAVIEAKTPDRIETEVRKVLRKAFD